MTTMRNVGVMAAVAWIVAACGGNVSQSEYCGTGTIARGNECIADGTPSGYDTSCGPGTYLSGSECLPLVDAGTSSGDDANVDASDGSASGDDGDDSVDVQTACLVSDNIFVIGGDDYIHTGPPLVIEGGVGWSVNIYDQVNGLPSFVDVGIGDNWSASFSTASLGTPLLPGTYTDAKRAEFTDPNHPGLDVNGDGGGCNMVTGQFTVIDMQASTDDAGTLTVQSFTATFEQHCEGGTQSNVGCVHVTQ